MTGRGVRKVSESILIDGRSLVVTQDTDSKTFASLPDGTIKVDPVTGQMFIKVAGESDWIPAGLRNDGTITIVRDSKKLYEVFVVKTTDNGDGTFTYVNENGDERKKPITDEGYYVFELEKGSYVPKRNNIKAIIDDTLHRTCASGGLVEIDEKRFGLADVKPGSEVTVEYLLSFKHGSPYPRFFIGETEPEDKEYGDFWLDTSEEID